jgi:hypothetical protein
VAAGIQSSIGLVQAGSSFSFLQGVGALGQGILAGYALPVVLVGGAVVGGIYLYKNYNSTSSGSK